MDEICGGGYRKALEFLIKDYLSKDLNEEESKQIKLKTLGNCIKDNIDNDQIKSMAQRAAWLGNDEIHYERKWEDKDLQDLKKFIDATIYWIEMVVLTEDTVVEMQ